MPDDIRTQYHPQARFMHDPISVYILHNYNPDSIEHYYDFGKAAAAALDIDISLRH